MSDRTDNITGMQENPSLPDDTSDAAEAPDIATDDEEISFLYMPEYEDSDTDAAEDEQEVFDRISSRPETSHEYVYPDLTLAQHISEIWYRHKGTIILFTVIALCLGVIVYSSKPLPYDVDSNVYVSYADFPTSVVDDLAQDMTPYVKDWDEDGEPIVYYYTINMADPSEIFATTNMIKMSSALQDKPSSMLWILDRCLYDMIIETYGEEMFESFEGAPLWVEITFCDSLSEKVGNGESPSLGFCLRRMTDELEKDKGLVRSYERAKDFLSSLKAEHPEMFTAD